MKKIRAMLVFGTRPEAIKMAPLYLEMAASQDFEPLVVVTAQHREMLDQVLEIFQIKPFRDLDLMKPDQPITHVVSQGLESLYKIFLEQKPDCVLVHGDTTTTFVASLAAFYADIPVGHVEAGLRTGNIRSPFPEEMNRRLTGTTATWHFSPTQGARDNLLAEGKSPHSIVVTGNTVIDALQKALEKPYSFQEPALASLLRDNEKFLLVTAHRRENFGQPLCNLFKDLKAFVEEFPDFRVVYPVHPNPNVLKPAREMLNHPRILLLEPLDYLPFINLMNRCHLIVTDSGGLQEEAPSLGKPVILFRDTTERPEAVQAGTTILAGTEKGRVLELLRELCIDHNRYESFARAANPFGDGQACGRIMDFLRERL